MSGLGRVWAEYPHLAGGSFVGDITASRYHSVILIDGENQALGPPAVMAAFIDGQEATFAVGDAKLAYSVRKSHPGEIPIKLTPNDFRLHKSQVPWMDLAWQDLPDWYSSQKLEAGDRRNQRYHINTDKEYNPFVQHERTWEGTWSMKDDPVQRAYRTAGLVRGKHPYVLIVDDIQKDDQKHEYKWLMQVADDLEIHSIIVADTEGDQIPINYRGPLPNYVADITLREGNLDRDDSGNPKFTQESRFLLVRVLESAGDLSVDEVLEEGNRYNLPSDIKPHSAKGTLPWRDGYPGHLETYLKYPRWHTPGKRLVIPSRSVAPNYKVLLFPYRYSEEIPLTVWDQDHGQLTVEWSDQRDKYDFSMGSDGRTRFRLRRDSNVILVIE
jgi:hypothetical protein